MPVFPNLRKPLLTALLACAAFTAQAAKLLAVAPPSCAAVTAQTCATAKALGRGVNFGNMLEAPREGDWGVRVEPRYIDLAASAFATVRLPVRWSNHAALTADATLDEDFAKRVDGVVDALLAKGLYVILDLHHYNQLTGTHLHPHEKEVAPDVVDTRLLNLWRQVARRYADRSPRLLFELVNEPNGRLDARAWNALAPQVLALPGVHHFAMKVGALRWEQLPARVDWLLVDVNLAPQVALHEIARLMPKLRPTLRGAVITMKLNDFAFVDALPSLTKRIADLGFSDVQLRHLPSNRREICCVAI